MLDPPAMHVLCYATLRYAAQLHAKSVNAVLC